MNKPSHKGREKLNSTASFVDTNMRNKEINALLGAKHVTTAKVLTTPSLNAKIFMHLTNPMIMRKILMINGSWL